MGNKAYENRILKWKDASWHKDYVSATLYDPEEKTYKTRKQEDIANFFSEAKETLQIMSTKRTGKVTDCGYDDFVCLYTELPADRDISINADIRIIEMPDIDATNGQEAFGLFLRDTVEREPGTGHHYSNMAAAGLWRGEYGLYGRDGITETDHGHVNTFQKQYEVNVDSAQLKGTKLHIHIERKDNTVTADLSGLPGGEAPSGEKLSVEFTEDPFRSRDVEHLFAGFLVARGFGIEVLKDTVEISIGNKSTLSAAMGNTISAKDEDPFRQPEGQNHPESRDEEASVIWASPDGSPDGNGREIDPYDLMTAVEKCLPGTEIKLSAGRYCPVATITLGDTATHIKGRRRLVGDTSGEERAVIDFGNTANCLLISGSNWDIEDIDVTRGRGICIEGHYNKVKGCNAYKNNETGILIRHHDNNSPRIEWPSYNLIENCSSYENCDPSGQHADGFACKVASGEGNRFIGCKAFMNTDDGFDLFCKNRKTGAVVIENCESSRNGYLYDEEGLPVESDGNGNGFKLGGSGEKVDHLVKNCSASGNRGCGFTNNSNPSMQLIGCTGYDNKKGDLKYYLYSDKADMNKIIENCEMGDERKVMIEIKALSKDYRLGQFGHGTLQKDLQSWWAKKRGKQDPNIKIGREKRITGDVLHALRDIDLTIYQGESVGIIGSNGAGKSTLLKLISRVASPTSGSIDLYGRVTSMLEVGTGFHGEMTGRENIYLNGAILGMTKSETESKIEEIIDFSEVRDYIDTPVKRYSSGMYVKLAFSVASHLDSEIVIMDEVLAVGDTAFQKKCIEKMKQSVYDENKTVLYVSHNMNTVRELCDRCIVLAEGRIIFDGDVEDAINCYTKYLQSRRGEEADLMLRERRDKNLTGICKVAAVKVPEESIASGKDLQFEVTFDSIEDRSGVRIRLLVCNGPGEIVGMSYSEPMDLRKGINRAIFSLPPGNLAPGEYVCDIAVFEFEKAVEIKHDFLHKVIPFRITEQVTVFGRPWKVRTWGNVMLDNIKTEELTYEQQE